jgi:hypothetical protein
LRGTPYKSNFIQWWTSNKCSLRKWFARTKTVNFSEKTVGCKSNLDER